MQFIQPEDIMGLFPTPVIKIPLKGQEFTQAIEVLKTLDMVPTNGGHYPSHLKSSNSYCLEMPGVSELRLYVESKISEYMKDVLSYAYPAQLTQSWINLNRKGDSTHLHAHPNSIVSAVFYMDLPQDNGLIRFHKFKPTGGTTYYMEPAVDSDAASKNFYAYDWIDIQVTTGDLVIFPSYLAHSVPDHQDDDNRWSLAMNAVPVMALGERDNLTELMLRATHS
jgi:uncharacterized protein (TIGR02466 family)